MSKEAMKWAKRQQLPDPSMKSLLLRLAYMHRAGQHLFPAQKTLAADTGQSPRTTWEALKLLEIFGFLARKPRSNGAKGRTSDEFELAVDRDIPVARKAISLARKGLRNSRQVRVESSKSPQSQLAPGASPPRTWREGIGRYQEELSHVRATGGSEGQYIREDADQFGPVLRLIAGGVK